jgi:UDP-2-acetamido-2-deoxy-ribo-hexuluronate aminotransferase
MRPAGFGECVRERLEFVDLKAQYRAIKSVIDARIAKVLEHGQFIMGPEVQELETALAEYSGAKYCVTCASGTEALLISLIALGIGRGDEVITTAFTFAATAETIALLGATPVFVDIDPVTYNLQPELLEASIGSKTKAIIPVSLYGQVSDMNEINAIAERHGIPVIEDAAQSFGAEYHGLKSCNLSTIGCTSFFPSKPLGCYGDGGAIFTSDEQLANAMREIRVHGQERRYFHTRVGVGGRMDTLQCAVVLAKLGRFDWELDQRRRVAHRYFELLAPALKVLGLPQIKSGRTSVFGQFTIRASDRDRLQKRLSIEGIPTAIHYPIPLHVQPAYANKSRFDLLYQTELAANSVISLPMYPDMRDEDQTRIVNAVLSALN